jgi:exopolyphosphatase/guanosine-5'-triphosphate,3'-diphosphate pyrophosphatase
MSDHASRLERAPLGALRRRSAAREVAVIDIGSNSVRLVVYRLDGRAMIPILNEKVMAGLGRDLPKTGALSAAGVEDALKALRRFTTIMECIDLEHVDVAATAAVRESRDGREFAARVEVETGLKVRILPGSEEARLSALGVLAAIPEAKGVVGDLGGSSLEAIEISPEGPGRGETFPLGPFALMRSETYDDARAIRAIDQELERSRVLVGQGGTFYAVGGAWRAIARIDITVKRHPLHVLQQYEMSRSEVFKVCDFVRKQSKRSLEKLEEAASRRADGLPYAAAVLERVLVRGGFSRVIVSSYGLREGLIFAQMSPEARAEHPLIATAEAYGATSERTRDFGEALAKWIEPIFVNAAPVFGRGRDVLLRAAAARLVDLGGPLHPDQRAELTFELVLRAPLVGISHRERAFLAAAVHHRYTRSAPDEEAEAYWTLLDDEGREAAMAAGAALRLGADISGRSEALLTLFRIGWDDVTLVVTSAPGRADLINEQALRRLTTLGDALGVKTRVDVS